MLEQEAEQGAWAGRKRFAAVGGLDLAYVEVAGSEPPLLLVHGFTDTSRSFSLLARHLAGRRLIMPDLRGHGASRARGGCDVADFAEDIAGLIRRLGLNRPIVVGHSLGAMVSIALASRYPQLVGGLVVMAGTLKTGFLPDHPLVTGVEALRDPISPADPFFEWWHQCGPDVPRAFLVGMAREASAIPAARWRAILEEIRRTDLTAAAKAVQAKTLIIAGACDPLFGEAHQQELAQALTGSRLVWAQDCGHNPHWEDPVFVAEVFSRTFGASDVP
ncbi:alpha/beta hydrolase [Mesorhizobium sp. M1C.F.Ca.ET.193.01.1.1]|uniref:alpha/beta fold hydrolase n=2 Tax=Mesorhizobium TaxID=68287 RepID=UPI000FD4D7CD|nr:MULTISPECIES: alpha/beta hydrolase [unclassified Mesorhizobium]TGS96396.1 alpha/beta hydrolase [bacterium M00.F.Ca.ET.177.01.1.1]TGQ52064.1 alpha/beta hydrolase [Mesorhizobium sp. M1C.F.Ca.ET.210.01.1.1]TGQ68709.1 alpha/beta hydrolase [Mesorhizobium sp. M1C.F.Ca.ET.212.01.1.1]TGR04127.1 alpha/beta hydrolase [Mesorhizobium sp. M1C.F.Ca.ET.204.01.1.1]TGR24791.1 alpha/beta hydrolase [Mesorhizobium sp. M1C.F.Ca.ET.196.01.1.1]